jgi:hypothetical protein
VDVGKLSPDESVFVSFKYAIIEPLEEGNIALTINSDSYKGLVVFQQPISEMSIDKKIYHPKIVGDLPLKTTVGILPLKIDFQDDGSIKESTIWLDGEKVGWQTDKSKLRMKLELDSGSHELLIQVKDNQELITNRRYHLWVEE